RAAERAGALDQVLERLADVAERRQDLARGIGLALLYPVLVVVVALGVVTALMTWVVPRVVQVFASAGEQLPLLTRVMMALSGFLQRNAGWLALLLIAVLALLAWGWRREAVRERVQGWMLAVPVLGAALRASATARACRSLSLQLASGVPLVDALGIASAAPGLVRFEQALRAAASEVREGASLTAALERSGVFPPMAQRLVASGEKSGRLAELLEHAAAAQEREAAARAQAFGAVLQPVLILLVGAFVLLVVLAVMLPILDLNLLVS
ncbi:MAG: type II secretion system F family protein, partial [Xanthomonadales bacterium]|nr:type II secretion system F family protein [Xanthomonadales bacterium]